LGDSLGENNPDLTPLAELIQHSQLRTFLQQRGYKTVAFSTGYDPTTIADADVFINFHSRITNDLETMLITTSAARALGSQLDILLGPIDCSQYHRDKILQLFENLKKIPEGSGPRFVFAHITAPHPPFVFGKNGESVEFGLCSGFDNSSKVKRSDYLLGYPQQAAFITASLEDTIDELLSKSDTPPVIIVQGDHGSGMLLDILSASNSCLRERTSILNAYYLPGYDQKDLYNSITPVNSFRVVLNDYFNTNLPLLEDKIYFPMPNSVYKFEDVTARIETKCDLSH
jgi:hypothetical protein